MRGDYMKKIILSVILLVMVIVACVALYSCTMNNYQNNDGIIISDETTGVAFDYVMIKGYTVLRPVNIGALIQKPQDPEFKNNRFIPQVGIAEDKTLSQIFPHLDNPTLADGYRNDLNYVFVGWYKEPEYYRLWNFAEDRVYTPTTLYAKWIAVSQII